MDTGQEEEFCCWICLGGPDPELGDLQTPCLCKSRPVHPACLARWQLQAAGQLEENTCRFCMQELPDWRNVLTPAKVKPVTPVMAIKFEGKTYKLRVQPGPNGLAQFKAQVRELLGFDITEEFDVSFECQVPTTGEKLKLSGLNSYGAATHCAAITAGEREVTRPHRHRHHRHHRHRTDSSNPTGGAGTTAQPPPASPGQADRDRERDRERERDRGRWATSTRHRSSTSRAASTLLTPQPPQAPPTPRPHTAAGQPAQLHRQLHQGPTRSLSSSLLTRPTSLPAGSSGGLVPPPQAPMPARPSSTSPLLAVDPPQAPSGSPSPLPSPSSPLQNSAAPSPTMAATAPTTIAAALAPPARRGLTGCTQPAASPTSPTSPTLPPVRRSATVHTMHTMHPTTATAPHEVVVVPSTSTGTMGVPPPPGVPAARYSHVITTSVATPCMPASIRLPTLVKAGMSIRKTFSMLFSTPAARRASQQ